MFGLLVQARIATWPAILMNEQTQHPKAGIEKGGWVRLTRYFLFASAHCIESYRFSVSYCVNLVYYNVRSTIFNRDCALIIVVVRLTR